MKIIENKYSDGIFPKRVICEHCGSVLEVERTDCLCDYNKFTIEYKFTYQCPCCESYNTFGEPKSD